MEINKLNLTPGSAPPSTVADLDAFPEDDGKRYELIEGALFVSRPPGIPHQRVLHNLQFEFELYLKANPIGILVPGAGAIFSNYDAVIPDLVFVRNERWDEVVTGEKFTGALDLIVEILSPGSQNRQRDLSAKRKLYGKYGVHPEIREVLVMRRHDDSFHDISLLKDDDELSSPLLPSLALKISTVFNI